MFHWQNLNDGTRPKLGGGLRHGRAWLGKWNVEWTCLWSPRFRFSFGTDDEDGLTLSVALVVASLHLSWSRFHFRNPREFSFRVFSWATWLQFWADPMGGSSCRDPWYSKMWVFHIDDFVLGSHKTSREPIGEPKAVLIPMPEGGYQGTLTFERLTWKRPRWFAKSTVRADVEIPGGIPFQGKGENGWDCGDDGLYSSSFPCTDEPAAIGKVVSSVLESRGRYGTTAATAERLKHVAPLNLAAA